MIEDSPNQQQAQLLKKIFSDDPWEESDPNWGPGAPWFVCKYCGNAMPNHTDDCSWIEYKALEKSHHE